MVILTEYLNELCYRMAWVSQKFYVQTEPTQTACLRIVYADKEKKHFAISRKCLTFNVDQPGLNQGPSLPFFPFSPFSPPPSSLFQSTFFLTNTKNIFPKYKQNHLLPNKLYSTFFFSFIFPLFPHIFFFHSFSPFPSPFSFHPFSLYQHIFFHK